MSYQCISIDDLGKGIYTVTLQKPPENRLNVDACQEIIRAYRSIVRFRMNDFDVILVTKPITATGGKVRQ